MNSIQQNSLKQNLKENYTIIKHLLSDKRIFIPLLLLSFAIVSIFSLQQTSYFGYKGKASEITGKLPNGMIEHETYNIYINRETREFSIGTEEKKVAFCFARYLSTGSECYTIWASTDIEGKNRISDTFPGSSRSLFDKTPRCPNSTKGKLDAGTDYPAVCRRIFTPLQLGIETLKNNFGILGESTHESHKFKYQPHEFMLRGTLPPGFGESEDFCTIYIHYSSNRQADILLADDSMCPSKPTPTITPTQTPTPTPLMGCPDIRGPYISKSACEELCLYGKGSEANQGSRIVGGGTTGSSSYAPSQNVFCQPGPKNPNAEYLGEWYCCPSANCGAKCSSETDCTPPLGCLPPPKYQPGKSGGDNLPQVNTCQDKLDCEETNSCWCKQNPWITPPLEGVVPRACYYFGSLCKSYCQRCYSESNCRTISKTGEYCLYGVVKNPNIKF